MIQELSELGKKTLDEFRNIKNLPTIPKVVLEVNEMLLTHSGDIARLTSIIGKDQGLTTKILSVANSPLYGLPRNVSSLEFGIMLLGMGEISNIVTALSLASVVKGGENKRFNYMNFWTHSMLVASASKDIAKRIGFPEIAGDAFVAGMLHDIGIQLTARYFPEQFETITFMVEEKNISYYKAEMAILGLTHEDIGEFLITKWNLPSNLAQVLQHHHRPINLGKANVTLNIVHLADMMTKLFDIGSFFWDKWSELDESIMTVLNFSDKGELNEFIEEYFEIFQDAADEMRL